MAPNSLFDKDRDRQTALERNLRRNRRNSLYCFVCLLFLSISPIFFFFIPPGCVPAGVCVNAAPVTHSGSSHRFLPIHPIHAEVPPGLHYTFPEGARSIVPLLRPSRRALSCAPNTQQGKRLSLEAMTVRPTRRNRSSVMEW